MNFASTTFASFGFGFITVYDREKEVGKDNFGTGSLKDIFTIITWRSRQKSLVMQMTVLIGRVSGSVFPS